MVGQEGQEGLERQEGREGLEGQSASVVPAAPAVPAGRAVLARPAPPAHPAPPALPALLLLVFFAFVRPLGEWTRPVAAALDCNHVEAGDVPALERCHAVGPDDVELMMDLGDAYERAAQWDRAEAIYRRAVEIDPDDGDVRLRLGNILLRRGEREGARREALAALVVQPGRLAVIDLINRASAHESAR